jgi:SAM-dependent methyltransferase
MGTFFPLCPRSSSAAGGEGITKEYRNGLVSVKKSPQEILAERRGIWKSKAVIRKLYSRWCDAIGKALRPGKALELGGGSGNLKEYFPHVITSDVIFVPWLDAVMDGHRLPFKDRSLDNIVLFDVLHHLAAPAVFFEEAERTLKQKGRVVIMEPYISPASFIVYQFFHPEGMKWGEEPFKASWNTDKKPFDSNQAIPTLIFEKRRDEFKRRYPDLKILHYERTDFLVYPLSGGFHHPSLCPPFLWNSLDYGERLLRPLSRFLAFRLFVVLEKN